MRSLTCSKLWQKTSIPINQISIISVIYSPNQCQHSIYTTTTAFLLGISGRAAHHCGDLPPVYRGSGRPLILCRVRLHPYLYSGSRAVCCLSSHARNSCTNGVIPGARGDLRRDEENKAVEGSFFLHMPSI